jgi:hypothetical protein
MHMEVENRLIGCLTVCEEHVHSLAREARAPQWPRQQMGDLEKRSA